MSKALIPVPYVLPTGSDTHWVVTPSPLAFEASVEAVKLGIEGEGLWVIQEIDPTRLARRGGYDIRPIRQVYFFHPRLLEAVLSRNPRGLAEVPFKFILAEGQDGATRIYHRRPADAFKPWPELAGVADTLETHIARILATLAWPVVPRREGPCA